MNEFTNISEISAKERASWPRLSVTAMLTETSKPGRRHGRATVWLDYDLPQKHRVMINSDGAGTVDSTA